MTYWLVARLAAEGLFFYISDASFPLGTPSGEVVTTEKSPGCPIQTYLPSMFHPPNTFLGSLPNISSNLCIKKSPKPPDMAAGSNYNCLVCSYAITQLMDFLCSSIYSTEFFTRLLVILVAK